MLVILALPLCLSLAVPQGGPALDTSSTFDLDNDGTAESSASSSVTSPVFGICSPCTIVDEVANGTANDWSFKWHRALELAGFDSKVKASKTNKQTWTTWNAVVEVNGTIKFSRPGQQNQTFNANLHKSVASAVLHYGSSLLGQLVRGTIGGLSLGTSEVIDFTSEIEQLSANEFEYTYRVANNTLSSITFSWPAALETGVVAPGQTWTATYVRSSPAMEVGGIAVINSIAGEETVEAHAWQPVTAVPATPLWAVTLLLATVVGTGAWCGRKCLAPQ